MRNADNEGTGHGLNFLMEGVVEMAIPLEQLIDRVLGELGQLGLSESTIKSYANSAYGPMRTYCARHETTCYEPTVLDAFLMAQKDRLASSEISERHFRKLRRAVLMIHDLHQHEALQDARYDSGSQYEVSEYFNRCLKQFIEAQYFSKGTIAGLKSIVLQFLCHLERTGHRDFRAISPGDVEDFLRMAADTHKGSMQNVVGALRLFLDYLRSHALVSIDFRPLLSRPVRRKKRVLPCFTFAEVEAILGRIDTRTNQGKRDYAIILLAAHTGLRSIDIVNLRLSHLDWRTDSIHIVQRKTGQPLALPLEPDTGNAIARYLLEARPQSTADHVFLRTRAPYRKLADDGSLDNILEKYLQSAGIVRQPGDGKSFHALRRSMGTWMLESGVPLTTISQVLGHKAQDSAKPYLSMDYARLASCARDFREIPLGRGIFQW